MDNQVQKHNQLTTAQQAFGGVSKLSPEEIAIGKQVYEINQVSAYPLSAEQIGDWARSIVEIKPEMTPEQLHEIIRQYKTGELEYNRHQGIQNIFEGYRELFGRGLVR